MISRKKAQSVQSFKKATNAEYTPRFEQVEKRVPCLRNYEVENKKSIIPNTTRERRPER